MTPPLADGVPSPDPARVIASPAVSLDPVWDDPFKVPPKPARLPNRTWDDEDHPTPVRPIEQVEQEICELAGHIAAATCRWLLLLAEFDRRDGWCVDGVLSMAHWLSWKCGVGLKAAHEQVRVARALGDHPYTRDAFMMGRLSYTKVRAITRAGAPQLDRELCDIARHATGAQVDQLVAGYRRAGRLDMGKPAHDAYGRWYYDEDGCVIVHARLSPEDGLVFVKNWEAAQESLRRTGEESSAEDRNPQADGAQPARSTVPGTEPDRNRSSGRLGADALTHLAECARTGGLGIEADNERYLALIHIDAGALRSEQVHEDSVCELNNGWAISPAVARLLTCDGSVAGAIIDGDGKLLDVGRKSRVVSKRLDRALKCRDRHCQAPGCTNAVYSWHHVVHWANGGPTDADNLVGLCKAHHYAVHEGRLIVMATGEGAFRFHRPDLSRIPDVPETREVWGGIEDQQPELEIDADTIRGNWAGEKLHLHYAVNVLMQEPATTEDAEWTEAS